MQAIIRIVEVLPAPFGPKKPKDSPRAMSKSMASTATKSPNRLVRARATTNGSGPPVTGDASAGEERVGNGDHATAGHLDTTPTPWPRLPCGS